MGSSESTPEGEGGNGGAGGEGKGGGGANQRDYDLDDTGEQGSNTGSGGGGNHDVSRPSIGRQVSSKRFKKGDIHSTQWKIFNELDVHDDKQMLDLAVFLRRLEKSAPGKEGAPMKANPDATTAMTTAEKYFHSDNVDGEGAAAAGETSPAERRKKRGGGMGIDIKNIHVEERPVQGIMRIGSVMVNLGPDTAVNLMDYSLPKGPPTMEMVHEVIQLFGAGGRLSIKSLRRILRDAYKLLKEMPNVMHINMNSPEETVTVVGDLHGQLADLLHLLDRGGMPTTTSKYVFNGDFVDRGVRSVEILVILFMLMVIMPQSVILNRGNHEDFGLCCVYGFQQECLSKYNDVIFSMFSEMFRHLPVCTVIQDRVLVIHGGLFHRDNVFLSDLEQIDRVEYVVPSRGSGDEDDSHLSESERREKDLRTLMHCALWSDPDLDYSLPEPQPNPRGAGVLFGPDMARKFLGDNKLDMVVRSHECVEDGFDMPYEGEEEGICATIFSASNYGGSMNRGAIMRFSLNEVKGQECLVAGGELAQDPPVYFTVLDYQLTPSAQTEDKMDGVTKANQSGLSSLVLRKKRLLTAAFKQVDKTGTGWLTSDRWTQVLVQVTGLDIDWKALLPVLVAEEDRKGDLVHWERFLNKFHVQLASKKGEVKNSGTTNTDVLFDAMYSNRDRLEAIFRFFDEDNNGSISREEFQKGCNAINTSLAEGEKLENFDMVLDLMDLDQNESIDINEFFEVFRICKIQS